VATPLSEVKKDSRRCVVWVPVRLGFLFDMLSRYTGKTKNELYQEIWNAGVEAHLGLRQSDALDLSPQPLPRGADAPKDIQDLVNALVGDA